MQIGTVHNMADARDARGKKKRVFCGNLDTCIAWVLFLRKFSLGHGIKAPREVPEWVPLGKSPTQREERDPRKKQGKWRRSAAERVSSCGPISRGIQRRASLCSS
ncbi:hypothetical protein CSPX01_06355 [Colletotrichum filicis]|nr:hypothetical protein CSPX01_06355 [Colletotrichum filicis]